MNKAAGYVNSLPKVLPIHTYALPNQGFHGAFHQPQYLGGLVPTQMYSAGQNMNPTMPAAGGFGGYGGYGHPLIQPQTTLMPVPNINDFLKSNRKTESDVSSSINSGKNNIKRKKLK